MKRITLAAILAASFNAAAAAPDLRCVELATRDNVCVRLESARVESTNAKTGTRTVVAGFIMAAPNNKILIRDHDLEVECSGKTPLTTAMRDKNGSRYAGQLVGSSPTHTQALARSLCEWEAPAKKGAKK